eukprot:g68591.t1
MDMRTDAEAGFKRCERCTQALVSLPEDDLDLVDPVVHPMFLEIAPTIDRLRFLQRAFPTSSHSNSSSLPIPLDKVLPMCSPLADVSEPVTFSQFIFHFSDLSSPYLSDFIRLRGRLKNAAHLQKCFASLLNSVRHFEWLSSVDSSAPQRYCARLELDAIEFLEVAASVTSAVDDVKAFKDSRPSPFGQGL